MVLPLGPKAYAGAIIEPKPPSFGLLLRNLEPLSPPNPLHPLVIHFPAFLSQKNDDPPVTIATISSCQLNDARCEWLVFGTTSKTMALC
jgi:hypothetical protein